MEKNRKINIYYEIGLRIRYLRKLKKMSIEDLALESDINKNYLCDLENGRRNPTLKILAKISYGLGVSLEVLFQGINNYFDI